MARRSNEQENCSIARALALLGDGWTMLILRDAFLGVRRFASFQSRLGISKNVLSDRLQFLVEHEILTRVEVGVHGSRFEYQMTPKGKDLATVFTALRQWGDRWIFGPGNEPLLVKLPVFISISSKILKLRFNIIMETIILNVLSLFVIFLKPFLIFLTKKIFFFLEEIYNLQKSYCK